jgi:hypothetical protein
MKATRQFASPHIFHLFAIFLETLRLCTLSTKMIKSSLRLLAFTAILAELHSCKPMPNNGIPFFLQIDSVNVSTNYSRQGANTSKISDIWVEANNSSLGAYEIPVQFPVLLENDVQFTINAGIKESGQSNLRVFYPFYSPDTFTLNANAGQSYHHTPIFRYKTATVFKIKEDFENSNEFDGLSLVTDSNVAYGNRCGFLSVSPVDSEKEAIGQNYYDLPEGQEIWIELDYKSEVPFWVGAYYKFGNLTPSSFDKILVIPKSSWSKIYIKISNEIGTIAADKYSLHFRPVLVEGSSGGSLYIDNVKLVTFNP